MSAEVLAAVEALDAAHDALGQIRLGDLTVDERDEVADERYRLNRLSDMLADTLSVEELDAREDDALDVAETVGDVEPDALTKADLPESAAVDMNAHHTVGTVEWPEYDGREWPGQTFMVEFLAEALERADDLQAEWDSVCRLSLPRVDLAAWDEHSKRQAVLELEGCDEVVVVTPYADRGDRVGDGDE